MSARLESPAMELKDSYLSLVDEFRRRGEPMIPFVIGYPADDFPAFLARLEKCALGSEIQAGFVAHQAFWLVDDQRQVVGVSSLRLSLTDALRKEGGHIGFGIRPSARRQGHATLILRETLVKARGRGITRALVTAQRANTGSVKAILRNGGVFDGEDLLPNHPDPTQRFWIANC